MGKMKFRNIVIASLTVCATACTAVALSACDGCGKQKPKTYTVSYSRGADDATGTIPETVSYAVGATVTLAAANTFARDGYAFESWSYGETSYAAGAEFTMPASDVTFTAVWKDTSTENPPDNPPDKPPVDDKDEPTLTELNSVFYGADNWEYMTNNNGATLDGGDIPYTLNDGSIKFHRLNQAVEAGDLSNSTASFMLKGTNDWSIWFNSSSKDNNNNSSYRLAFSNGGLRLVVSSAPEQAAAVVENSSYVKGEWNRFDVEFSTENGVCRIKLYINGERATLAAGTNTSPAVSVADNVLTHTQPAMFVTGDYIVVKVWEAHNYVQIKPVAKAEEKDVPIIACIGASITEGAGAGNFYTESYPAQLQNALGGAYNVVNFGNSGKTVKLNPEDGEAWLAQNQWTGVQAIKPDMAILNIGTNDSKDANMPSHDSFKAAYEYLLEQILSVNPDMKIYICTVPYAYSSVYGISNENIRDIIAPVQREIAAENGYTLIDLYNIVQNKSLLFGDGVHPNTTGYAMFVEIISKVLEEGQAGLTEEFLEYIDEKYNDPAYELSGVRGAVEVVGDEINLTVTGNIVMDDVSRLRLVVETGTDGEEYEVAMTPDGNGDFSGTINLAALTSTKWYNVRVYLTDTFYYFVRLDDTDCTVGQTFNTDTKLVTVKSWVSGGENTFSFTVGNYTAFSLTSSTIIDNVLTVSGTSDDGGIRLYIGADPTDETKYNEYKAVTVGADGAFTASFDLSELPVGGWYNARIYFTDGSYKTVPLAQTTDGTNVLTTNDYFLCESTKVEIKSWTDGGVGTLSFAVSAYSGELIPELNVTEATLIASDGKIMFTIKGTTNDEGLRLYIGNAEDNENYYHPITVEENGSFTAEFDLATLAPEGGWYNVRLYYYEDYYVGHTDYYTVLYTNVKNASGNAITKETVLFGTDTKVTVKSWAEWNPLSLLVEEYDSSYTVTADSIKFEDGYFVLTGSARNVNNLYVYLINTNVAGSENNYVEAQITGGSFTARLPLDNLLEYAKTGTPFNLRYKVNDVTAATVNVTPEDLDMTQIYWSGVKVFYLGTNGGCAAVYYTTDYAYGLTSAEIKPVDGKATLILEGALKAADTLPETLYLLLDENDNNTGKQKILVANSATEAGTFKFAVDISTLEGSTEASTTNGAASRHYYIRLYSGNDLTVENYAGGTKLADINSRWLADKLFKEITVVGDSSGYYFIRNTNNATYNTLGIVRVGKNSAVKLADLDDVSLGYYTTDSTTVELAPAVDANGTAVTYAVSAADPSLVELAEENGVLTVRAKALSGETTVTVEVLSDGAHAFDLQFKVSLSDAKITKTNNYASFISAESWKDIIGDGNDKPKYDSYTNSCLIQWGNSYQEIGATDHISFELWVNGAGSYGFELWLRSTTNDKNVAGNKYVMNGYGDAITISRESGSAIASFPKFAASTFTRFDITFFDVYEDGNLVKTIINVYQNGLKVMLTGSGVTNGSIVDNAPIVKAEGIYFAAKSWEPQIAIRTASEVPNLDAIRVATVGDSITYGHAWHNESYPVYLETELGSDYAVGNYGHNGASITGFGGSGEKYSNLSEYNGSISFAPDVIVIMLGSNDANGWANAASGYESELRALVAAYQAACPNAKIILVTSPPTLDNNAYGIPNDTVKNVVNPIQRQVAQELGLTLVDLREAMESEPDGYNSFFREGDGVHLSVEGAQFAAKLIGEAIKSL